MFTGLEGINVPIEETIESFELLVNGELDDLPEQAFLNVGNADGGPRQGQAAAGGLMAFEAQLVSPERVLYTGQATQVLCRTVGGGDIAFLTDHAPMIGALDIWAVKITTTDNREEWFAVHGGFVEVSGDSVIILSDVAEAADQIDAERAAPRP